MLQVLASDIIVRVRERTRRENSNFVSDAEYLRCLDVAWRRCYNRMAKKVPRYFAVDLTMNLVAGQRLYPLPAAVRSIQYVSAFEPSWGSYRQLRPLQESELVALTDPQEGSTCLLKYTPEPFRIVDGSESLPTIATSDEWLVNCVAQMTITKEGTERQNYDVDFAMLDADLQSFLDDYDQSWPQSVNEVFPFVSAYPYPRTLRVEGYILRGTVTGHEIEFWASKFPAIYPT